MLAELMLDGRVAIVTGASRGIGKAIAVTLAEAGADVVVAARNSAQIEETAEEVRKLGRRCLPVPTDVSKSDHVETMVARTLEEFGEIDILVNNAGVDYMGPIVSMEGYGVELPPAPWQRDELLTEERWRLVIDTNLNGVYLCTRAVGPHMMKQRRGKIINVSSVEAERGNPYDAAYAATKAAINNFTRSIAREWAPFGINVNAIGPGAFLTDMTRHLERAQPLTEGQMEGRIQSAIQRIPLKRWGSLRELGLLAVYLASHASDYISGQTIYLDGGLLA